MKKYNSIAKKETILLKMGIGTEQIFFSKKTHKWPRGPQKGVQPHYSSGNANEDHNEIVPHTC